MKFRKKPVVIEAREWTGTQECFDDLYAWGNPCGDPADAAITSTDDDLSRGLTIFTLEGTHHASLGDWIIQGVKGEFYPCKPDIFAATYEPAPSAAPTLCRFCVAQGRPPHTEGECPHHNRPSPSAAPATGGEEP